jgi:ribosomal RNA-processing protein 36
MAKHVLAANSRNSKQTLEKPSKFSKIEEDEDDDQEKDLDDDGETDKEEYEEDEEEDEEGDEDSNELESDEEEIKKTSRKEREKAYLDNTKQSIRNELSQMTFAEIQALQNKLGLKKFKEVMMTGGGDQENDDDDDDASSENDDENKNKKTSGEKTVRSFKRLNKNRPREMTSKKPVPKFRNVFNVKKQELIDPRFNSALGEYRPEVFRKQYGFVNDMRKNEIDVNKFLTYF